MHARLLSWSLRHRRWRHLLNAITMAVTVSVVMLFVSVMVELVAFVQISGERELTRILVFPKIISPGAGVDGLPLTLKANLEKLDGAKVVQRIKTFGGRHPTSGSTYIIVGEEDSGVELNTDFFPVALDVQEAWKKERLGAIVTTATARDLGLEVGETAEIPSSLGKIKIKVVGLSHGALVGHRIAIHFDYAQELAKQIDSCGYRVFTAPADFARVAREINDTTRNSPMPAQAVSDAHFAASWARKAGLVPALLGFLGMFLVFTTALTLANNSAISIRERRTETATMRVLGYKRSTIIRMLLVEAVLVGVLGGLLAVALMSLVFSGGVQLTPGSSKLLQAVEIGVPGIICGLIASVVIPLAGALPSALATVRTPLVVALRDSA